MNPTPGPLGLAAILLGALTDGGLGADAGPLRVTVRVLTPGPPLVGQGVEIRLELDGAAGPSEVEAPRPAPTNAEVHRLAPSEPLRFVVVPRKPGPLVIPPFRVRSGDRSGLSRPTRLAVENVPTGGRSAAFLGGVGPFEARAEANPAALRLGESLEYRLRLTGPAAWGSDRPPDLGGWAATSGGFRVEPLESRLEPGEPASRTFRYRIRPARAGRLVLPPVPVAGFDPATRRYATRVAPGVPIEVEAPPRFDPALLDDRVEEATAARWAPRFVGLGVGILVALTVGLAWISRGRARAARRPDLRRVARDLARGLDGEGVSSDHPGFEPDADAARRVVEALAEFLRRAGARPIGALTPAEAREDVARLTTDGDLADDAGRLVESCDRARFGGRGEGAGRWVARGRDLLERLGEAAGAGAGEGTEGGSRDR